MEFQEHYLIHTVAKEIKGIKYSHRKEKQEK